MLPQPKQHFICIPYSFIIALHVDSTYSECLLQRYWDCFTFNQAIHRLTLRLSYSHGYFITYGGMGAFTLSYALFTLTATVGVFERIIPKVVVGTISYYVRFAENLKASRHSSNCCCVNRCFWQREIHYSLFFFFHYMLENISSPMSCCFITQELKHC